MPGLAADAYASGAKINASAATPLWVVTAMFNLVNAVGYSATNCSTAVAHRAEAVRLATDQRQHLETATEELAAMKANPRWITTSACLAAAVPQSIAFCRQVTAKQDEIAKVQQTMPHQTAGMVDAEAATLATGISADWVALAMPILMAVVFELAAGLSFLVAHGHRETESAVEPVAEVQPVAEPVRQPRDAQGPVRTKMDRPGDYAIEPANA